MVSKLNYTFVAFTYNQVSIACSSVSRGSSTCVAPSGRPDSRELLAVPRHAGVQPPSCRPLGGQPRFGLRLIAHLLPGPCFQSCALPGSRFGAAFASCARASARSLSPCHFSTHYCTVPPLSSS